MPGPAPIAVFAYSRHEHLRLAVEALARCEGFADHPLYIFCDGARSDADAPPVRATCETARQLAHDHHAQFIERPVNLGFDNIVQGITQLCRDHGRCIIVEDDILVAPDFLTYMQAALDRYEDEPRVGAVSGFMYPDTHPPHPPAFFIPAILIWGWATWQRAWQHYDPTCPGWQKMLADRQRKYQFDFLGQHPFSRLLRQTMTGRVNTWDIQWTYTLFQREALVLHPWRSLTFNTGLTSGIHYQSRSTDRIAQGKLTQDDFTRPRLDAPLAFPSDVALDLEAFRRCGRRLARYRSPAVTARNVIRRLTNPKRWLNPR